MDTDLAFCLENFIHDQVQLIDDRIRAIEDQEAAECEKIRRERSIFEKKKPPEKNNGSHNADQALVDRFIQELRDKGTAKEKRTVIDDETCIATLRAETQTKVNATGQYVVRLKNSARSFANTKSFIETCNETVEYFNSAQNFQKNFDELMTILQEADADTVVQRVRQWWKNAYGSRVAEVNTRNSKFNQAATENNYATLTQTNRIFDNAKKLIAARTVVFVEPPKLEIIRKFVQQLFVLDEDKQKETTRDELIKHLNSLEIDGMNDYARQWLKKRDDIRNKKPEPDQFEIRLEEVRAECGRQRIAQEATKFAVAAVLCRLAVGSTNDEQFNKQLKKTVTKQKNTSKADIPVISGEIQQPEAQELPVIVQLELDTTNMNRWVANDDNVQEQFSSNLCKAFLIPTKNIRVDNVDRNKGMIYLIVKPPYGKKVVDSLNGAAPDAAARMQAVRKCCEDMNASVESITLGEFGLKVEDKLMDPRWNKIYGWQQDTEKNIQFWSSPINQGGRPYYCPSGWKRFGIKVAEDDKEFDARWGSWYLAYHGTRGENASKILTSGLKVSTTGCFYNDGEPRVYVSPSIEYCAHPRYAYPWKQAKQNGKVCWYQLVFQCRVNPASIKLTGPETLLHNQYKKTVQIDPNFDNNELEWIIIGKEGEQFITKDIVCYGLMLRVSNTDPETLTPSAWWKNSHYADIYKK